MAHQLVIALHYTPRCYAHARHPASPLLSLQQQSVAHLLRNSWKQSEGKNFVNLLDRNYYDLIEGRI